MLLQVGGLLCHGTCSCAGGAVFPSLLDTHRHSQPRRVAPRGLPYLAPPCCSSVLPGGLQSAASSQLKLGKVNVIEGRAPSLPPQHGSSPGLQHLPALGFPQGSNPAQRHGLQSSPSEAMTGPGCVCSLPATDVSFLLFEWGCSWPAMRKGRSFNFGFIFIDFVQCS